MVALLEYPPASNGSPR